MMKKIRGLTSFLLVAVLLMSTVFNGSLVFAADNITVEIDGQRVNFSDQQPVIKDGKTLVPIRGVFEMLGYTVSWEQSTQTATLSNGVNTVIITVGKSTFTTNGNTYSLDVPAQIINGKTMLPFRAVLESVGCSVDWNGSSNTVIVSSAEKNTTSQKATVNIPVIWVATSRSNSNNKNYIQLPSTNTNYTTAYGSNVYESTTFDSNGYTVGHELGTYEIQSNAILFTVQEEMMGYSLVPLDNSYSYTVPLTLNANGEWVPSWTDYNEYTKTNSVPSINLNIPTSTPEPTPTTIKYYDGTNVPDFGMFTDIQPDKADENNRIDYYYINISYSQDVALTMALKDYRKLLKDNGWTALNISEESFEKDGQKIWVRAQYTHFTNIVISIMK